MEGRTVPRYLDPAIEGRVTDETRRKYRRALSKFLGFILSYRFRPSFAIHIDDSLVEWKNLHAVSKSEFETAVAAIEYCIP